MDALELEADGYSGSYKLVGGRVAFDFVNTISWFGTEREHEWLSSPRNVVTWFNAVGLADHGVDESDARSVREVIRSVLGPVVHGQTPGSQSVARFNRLLQRSWASRAIDPQTLAWSWIGDDTAAKALGPVILDAAEILIAGGNHRLKHCPGCDWLFEDQTRNGRRRWCDMADCGSRAKSREYYHRTRRSDR